MRLLISSHLPRHHSPENQMSLDPTTFETVVPSCYMTFIFPNPLSRPFPAIIHTPLTRISIIDSPTPTSKIAAMFILPNRELDWTFFTETSHYLLVTFWNLSCLVLITNNSPNCSHPTSYIPPLCTTCTNTNPLQIEEKLTPLSLALTPKSPFVQSNGFPEIPFLSYEDEVKCCSVLKVCVGPCVGEMLKENVELELVAGGKEFSRRLRFKRMPNLVWSQMRIHLHNESDLGDELHGVKFRVDVGVLVQPYLNPMVVGFSVISSHLEGQIQYTDSLTWT